MGLVRDSLNTNTDRVIYCDTLTNNILMKKGISMGDNNLLNNKIIVEENQFLIVVDDYKIVDFTAEEGQYAFNKNLGPLMLCGKYGKILIKSYNKFINNNLSNDQKFYFMNVNSIKGNKFGTKTPIVFKDSKLKSDLDIRCYGEYTFQITNPIDFYYTYCTNIDNDYILDDKFKDYLLDEFLEALKFAFTRLSLIGISYKDLIDSSLEITKQVKDYLSLTWNNRGIGIVDVSIASLTPTDESAKVIVSEPSKDINESNNIDIESKAVEPVNNADELNEQKIIEEETEEDVVPLVDNIFGDEPQVTNTQEEVKCPNCGVIIKENFCNVCGTKKP